MKTWEMMKVLTENPDAKFVRLDCPSLVYHFLDGRIVVDRTYEKNDKYIDGPLNLNADWELVDELVPFEEALKALREGKTVECRGCKKDFRCKYEPVTCEADNPCLGKGILNGKWKIL